MSEQITASEQQPAPAGPPPAFIRLSRVLSGVRPFKTGNNVNDTYRGQLVLDDGSVCSAIIKDLDQRQLANELMAAALANAAGLPVPAAFLSMATPDVLDAKKGPTLANGARLVFASADAHTPPVSQLYLNLGATADAGTRICQRLAEWKQIGDLYGFDTWIANIDRHAGNLLFNGDKEVWLIDHGHCFTGPTWKAADLVASQAHRNRLKEWLTSAMSDVRRAAAASSAAALATRVQTLNLAGLVEANHVSRLMDSGDFTALIDFLKARNTHVPKLAAAALDINLAV